MKGAPKPVESGSFVVGQRAGLDGDNSGSTGLPLPVKGDGEGRQRVGRAGDGVLARGATAGRSEVINREHKGGALEGRRRRGGETVDNGEVNVE